MRRYLLTSVTVLLSAAANACAPAGQRVYVAPTNETVVTSVEEAPGSVPSRLIYVHNQSTVPIVINSVTLRSCENIRGLCGDPRRFAVRVGPGERRVVLRVEPANPERGSSFRYTFSWTPAEP